MGLEAGGRGAEEEEKKEKIPHLFESIGHRPLQGRCPKGKFCEVIVPWLSWHITFQMGSDLRWVLMVSDVVTHVR